MEQLQKTAEPMRRERVILVGLHSPRLKREENADDWSMEELAALTDTAGGCVAACALQNKDAPGPAYVYRRRKSSRDQRTGCLGAGGHGHF